MEKKGPSLRIEARRQRQNIFYRKIKKGTQESEFGSKKENHPKKREEPRLCRAMMVRLGPTIAKGISQNIVRGTGRKRKGFTRGEKFKQGCGGQLRGQGRKN